MSFVFEVAAKTDVGCVRISNEDNFGYDTRRGIFVVCDGTGGHAAGEVASKIAVDSLLKYFRDARPSERAKPGTNLSQSVSERAKTLGNAIQLANNAIREAARREEGQAGMGSTIVCVLVADNFFSIGHVGDSRAYLIRQGVIQQLTQDHSLVMEQLRRGLITSEQAEKSNLQNMIIRALGSEEMVEPDLDDLMAISDDVLLLASDGLTRALSEQEILAAVSAAADLERACNDLIQSAKDAGADDNITCLLIRFVEQRWYHTCLHRFRIWGSANGKAVSQV